MVSFEGVHSLYTMTKVNDIARPFLYLLLSCKEIEGLVAYRSGKNNSINIVINK